MACIETIHVKDNPEAADETHFIIMHLNETHFMCKSKFELSKQFIQHAQSYPTVLRLGTNII